MSRTAPPRIAVLGAGPVGLEAALYAASLEPAGHRLRARPGRRAPPPVGPRPPVQPLRHEHHAAGPGRPPAPRTRATSCPPTATSSPAANTSPPTSNRSPRSPLAARLHRPDDARSSRSAGAASSRSDGAGDAAARPAAVPPAAARRQRARSASRRPTWCSTAPAPTASPAGSATAASRPSARSRRAAADRLRPRGRPRRAAATTTPAGRRWSSAAATRRRRPSAAWPRLAEKHPATWVIWLARGRGRSRSAASSTTRSASATGSPAGQHAGDARRGQRRVPLPGRRRRHRAAGPDKGFTVTAPRRRQGEDVGGGPRHRQRRLHAGQRLYRELQVHECYASLGPMDLAAALLKHAGGDCLSIPGQGAATLRNPEPNFYILGAKSYGRNSNSCSDRLRAGARGVHAHHRASRPRPLQAAKALRHEPSPCPCSTAPRRWSRWPTSTSSGSRSPARTAT